MALTRREFCRAGLSGLAAASWPLVAAPQRRHRIGHTGITWGYAAQNAPLAIAEVGALGFQCFESFGSVLEYWESRGGLEAALHQAHVQLIGAYCPMLLSDPARRKDEVAKLVRWGALIRKYGGHIAVIGPDNVDRASFDYNDHRPAIIAALSAMGSAMRDLGITAALHQHTGSSVMTRDELHDVMASVDAEALKLCPDTGEMLAAGIDPVQAVRDFLPRIAHVHLKDYNGGSTHDGYCPIGHGRVDMAAVCDLLDTAMQDFAVMAELNPEANGRPSATAAGDLAAMNKSALLRLGYSFF